MAQHNRKDDDGTKPLKNIHHENFCNEYFKDFSPKDAYTRAGYKAKNVHVAYVESYKLLKNPIIMRRLQFLKAERDKQMLVDKTFIINGFKRIAQRTMEGQEILVKNPSNGEFVPIETFVKDPDTELETKVTLYQFNPKEANKAFENLAKYTGELQENKKLELSGVIGVADVPLTVEEKKEKALKLAKYLGESVAVKVKEGT